MISRTKDIGIQGTVRPFHKRNTRATKTINVRISVCHNPGQGIQLMLRNEEKGMSTIALNYQDATELSMMIDRLTMADRLVIT